MEENDQNYICRFVFIYLFGVGVGGVKKVSQIYCKTHNYFVP